jgi:tight adherence protein C
MSLIIAAAFALAAYLLVRALAVESRAPASAWRDATFGTNTQAQAQSGGVVESALRTRSRLEKLAGSLPKLQSWQDPAQRMVEVAGMAPQFSGASLIGAAAVLAVGGLLLGLLTFSRDGFTPQELAQMAGATALFGFAPVIMVSGRGTRRRDAIDRALPDVMDLLVVSVEAGLALEGALQRVSARASNPLTQEIQRTLNEISLGRRRYDALQSMGARTQVQPLQTLVNAMNQAERTGMQMGPVLRAQSEQIRTRRRQIAEEKALKAPLKMLFPLAFFIFPAMFLVILGPAVIPFL